MADVPGLFYSIKVKVAKGEKLNAFECLVISYAVIAVTTKLMHDWFGISPKMHDNVEGDDHVEDIQ